MPHTHVVFYRESDSTPVLDWLDDLHSQNRRAYNKCIETISRLEQFGHELRRPTADLLQDGIYELRAQVGHVNYRILYFFHGRNIAILAHALTKERNIPTSDLATALHRKLRFERNPLAHTHQE